MHRNLCLSAVALIVCAAAPVAAQTKVEPKSPATATPPAADAHAADRTAIRAVLASLAKAFEAGDAKALATHWTAGGEFHNTEGKSLQGRETLERAFGLVFAKATERKAEVRPQALRFLSDSSAIDEGTVVIRKGAAAAPTRARYEALFVKEQGQWRIATLRETPDLEASINDLAWLIGSWKSTGAGGAEIQTTYSWDAQRKFIHVEFQLAEKGLKPLKGKQVIGVDPATGGIRSWTFEASGGVGEGDWHADGDHWAIAAEGTLPDGRELVETNVLRRINDDTFTWQSVQRMLGDQPLADLAPVKVVRVKAEAKAESNVDSTVAK